MEEKIIELVDALKSATNSLQEILETEYGIHKSEEVLRYMAIIHKYDPDFKV